MVDIPQTKINYHNKIKSVVSSTNHLKEHRMWQNVDGKK